MGYQENGLAPNTTRMAGAAGVQGVVNNTQKKKGGGSYEDMGNGLTKSVYTPVKHTMGKPITGTGAGGVAHNPKTYRDAEEMYVAANPRVLGSKKNTHTIGDYGGTNWAKGQYQQIGIDDSRFDRFTGAEKGLLDKMYQGKFADYGVEHGFDASKRGQFFVDSKGKRRKHTGYEDPGEFSSDQEFGTVHWGHEFNIHQNKKALYENWGSHEEIGQFTEHEWALQGHQRDKIKEKRIADGTWGQGPMGKTKEAGQQEHMERMLENQTMGFWAPSDSYSDKENQMQADKFLLNKQKLYKEREARTGSREYVHNTKANSTLGKFDEKIANFRERMKTRAAEQGVSVEQAEASYKAELDGMQQTFDPYSKGKSLNERQAEKEEGKKEEEKK